MTLLETRLAQKGKRVTRISLAECLDEAMRSQRPLEEWFAAEREQGVETIVETVHSVLSEYAPLVDLVAARMPDDPDPLRDVVFILRTGALFPVYRTFSLLEQLKGRCTCRPSSSTPATSTARRPALHGRARRRAQLPPEDLLTRTADDDAHSPSRRSSPTTSTAASKRSSRSTRPTRRSSATRSTSTSSRTRSARTTRTSSTRYRETPNKPHEGIAIWVSGFFGSGKSSFAKMLGLSIENRAVAGEPAAERFAAARRRQQAPGAAQGHQREDPDPRGDLRRLDRPRHPQRQPDAHRDHVRALPPEPRLREGPRPLRARDRLEEKGSSTSFEDEYQRLFEKDWDDREGQGRLRAQRGEPRAAQPRARRRTRWPTRG